MDRKVEPRFVRIGRTIGFDVGRRQVHASISIPEKLANHQNLNSRLMGTKLKTHVLIETYYVKIYRI